MFDSFKEGREAMLLDSSQLVEEKQTLNTNILARYKDSEEEKGQTENNGLSNETSGHGPHRCSMWSKGRYNPYDFSQSCHMDGKLGEKSQLRRN